MRISGTHKYPVYSTVTMLSSPSNLGIKYVHFFYGMKLDLARKLPDLWNDVYRIARKNGYLVDMEFNTISLYHEHSSRLSVIKITAGRDMHVEKVTRLVFERPRTDPVEQYEMAGTDGNIPIWKEI